MEFIQENAVSIGIFFFIVIIIALIIWYYTSKLSTTPTDVSLEPPVNSLAYSVAPPVVSSIPSVVSSRPPGQLTTLVGFYGNNVLQLSQVVITDINNNNVRPTSMTNLTKYNAATLNIESIFNGILQPQSFPNLFVSSSSSNVVFEITIPPSMIKSITIYSRSDNSDERLGDFTLKLKDANGNIINSTKLQGNPPNHVQTINY